jgi:hypothetical protein
MTGQAVSVTYSVFREFENLDTTGPAPLGFESYTSRGVSFIPASGFANGSKTVMVVPTDCTRDTKRESAKSGNLYATHATCEQANFGCNLLTPLVDLEGFEPGRPVDST